MKFFNLLKTNSRSFCTEAKAGRLKATFSCAKTYRDEFSNSTAQMTISVGQLVHEGERLQSITQLINRYFASCKIVIDDSIQSYTMGIGAKDKTKTELLAEAIAAGDAYIERNQPLFKNNFTIPFEIVRWRDWLYTPLWKNAINDMQVAYRHNPKFRYAVEQSVQTFLTRYERQHANQDYDRAHAHYLCTEYLLEECGVMKEIWIKLGCHYEVYPSGRNEAMAATHTLFIEPYYPHILRSVAIRFNRRSSPPTLVQEGMSDETENKKYNR